jgi:soluble lytic murein transglycosylase-like protein
MGAVQRQVTVRGGVGASLGTFLALLGAFGGNSVPASAEVYSYRDRLGVVHFTNAPADQRFRPVPPEPAQAVRSPFDVRPRPPAFDVNRSPFLTRRSLGSLFSPQSEPSPALARMIDETSRRYGVDAALVHAIVRAESGFDHLAVSSKGAQGLMQLMPMTASEVGVRDAFQPRQNLEGGVSYLRELLDRFSGNTRLALAAYNAGPGAVDAYGGVPPFGETRDYVSRVFRYRDEHLRRQIDELHALADGDPP